MIYYKKMVQSERKNTPFARIYIYMRSQALLHEFFALIRESYGLILEKYASIRKSFAFICENTRKYLLSTKMSSMGCSTCISLVNEVQEQIDSYVHISGKCVKVDEEDLERAFIFVNDFVPDVRRSVGDMVLGTRVKISFASFYGWVDTLVTTSEKIPSKIVNFVLSMF